MSHLLNSRDHENSYKNFQLIAYNLKFGANLRLPWAKLRHNW